MIRLLAFDLGDARYALRADLLQEVTRAVAVSPLPAAPAAVEGVINVRGVLAPVIDMRRQCRLPARPNTPDQHFLIARTADRLVALRVDRASDLVTVADDAIASAASVAPGADGAAGIARLPDGVLVIHDLDRFLSPDEARQLDTALAHVAAPEPRA